MVTSGEAAALLDGEAMSAAAFKQRGCGVDVKSGQTASKVATVAAEEGTGTVPEVKSGVEVAGVVDEWCEEADIKSGLGRISSGVVATGIAFPLASSAQAISGRESLLTGVNVALESPVSLALFTCNEGLSASSGGFPASLTGSLAIPPQAMRGSSLPTSIPRRLAVSVELASPLQLLLCACFAVGSTSIAVALSSAVVVDVESPA